MSGLFSNKPVEKKEKTDQTQTYDLPDWLTDWSKTLVDMAGGKAKNPVTPYGGDLSTGLGPDFFTGMQGLRNLFMGQTGMGMGGSGDGGAVLSSSMTGPTTSGGMPFNPTTQSSIQGAFDYAKAPAQKVNYQGTFDSGDIQKYMNPYVDAALNPAIRKIQEAGDAARNRIRAMATNSGAAGTFRDARVDNMLIQNDQNTSQNIGDTAANFNLQAFRDAVGQKTTDLNRDLDTQKTNAQLAEMGLDRLFKGSGAALDRQGAGQAQQLQLIQSLLQGDMARTGVAQSALDRNYQEFLRQQGQGDSDLKMLLSILSGVPTDKTVTSTGTNVGTQSGGLGPGWGLLGAAIGAAGKAAAAASDIRLKRDVARIGTLESGLPVYSFRYLWSDVPHVGVMAQEAAEVFPDAVFVDANGFLMVDYSRIA